MAPLDHDTQLTSGKAEPYCFNQAHLIDEQVRGRLTWTTLGRAVAWRGLLCLDRREMMGLAKVDLLLLVLAQGGPHYGEHQHP